MMKKTFLNTIMASAYMSTFLQFISLYLNQPINVKLIYTSFIIIAIVYLIFKYLEHIIESNKANSPVDSSAPLKKTSSVKSAVKIKKSELLKSIQLLKDKIKKS